MFRGPRSFFEHARGRFFERGDIKYLVLHLLKDKPKHGYEIMKEIGESFGGFYSPSPGAIYPTLQMLEDMGYVTSTARDGRKVYEITEEGRQFLEERDHVVDEVRDKVKDFWGSSIEKDMRALAKDFHEFTHMFRHSVKNVREDPERLRRIRDVVARAQKEVFDILTEKEEPQPEKEERQ